VRFLFAFLFTCLAGQIVAQGIYTEFGQSRVQKKTETYSLKQDQIEIIYHAGGEELAKIVFAYVIQQLPEFETKLNYNLSNGIKIVVYNHFIDYQNSNINIINFQQSNSGYSYLTDNTSSIYFSGSRIDLYRQTRRAIAEVLISEFIYGGDLRERIQNSALLTLPTWYYKGLVAYLAESWNVENDNYLKDFLLSGKAHTFTSLQEEDEVLAGHSIWRYLEEKYGAGSVSNVVFITCIGRSVESAFNYYTGLTINSMLKDWEQYYKDKYSFDESTFKLPKGQENVPDKLAKKRITQFKLSPDGKQIAIVTNTRGRYQVVLYNVKTKKSDVIFKGGHQIFNQQASYDYPLIAWDKDGKTISIITFKNNQSMLTKYNTNGKKGTTTLLENVPIIKDFTFNSEGTEMVMSIIRKGQSDIIIYNLQNKTISDITNDIYDDLNPRFSFNNERVLFSSNREWPTQTVANYYSIFEIEINNKSIQRIAGYPKFFSNYFQPIELQNNYISFLSDANGIVNNYAIKRNDTKIIQLTNYKRSILYNDVASNSQVIADLLFFKNHYRIYVGELAENLTEDEVENPRNTAYRNWLTETKVQNKKMDTVYLNDSTKNNPLQNKKDTLAKIHKKVFLSGYYEKDDLKANQSPNEKISSISIQKTKLNFGVNYSVTLFDNSYLNNYLFQANVNESVLNNPFLLNTLLQAKITDNLKNYQFEAGARIPVSIRASDYFLKYTNLKGRWDQSFFFHRRGRLLTNENIADRMVTEVLKYTISYPFNERSKINLNAGLRQDRLIALATDSTTAEKPTTGNVYFSAGAEYVYDNVQSKGLNIFEGLKFKIYSDNYFGINKQAMVMNTGFDGRYYLKLHRQIYIATRLSGAFSIGPQKTGYYLGGVENEIGKVNSNSNFNYSIPTLTTSEYSFQTLVAPMRGFKRNTRGGSNFALLNTEIRIPVLSYLIQKPITSEFLRSIMFIGFIDMGTAWQGSSPYDKSNPFNTQIITTTNYFVSVTSQRNPMLYSTGIGVRAKILYHYVKLDYGWGYLENKFLKGMTTFSYGLDF
jgi:Tol biopolymer transport system component